MTNLVNIPEESSSLSQYFFKLAKKMACLQYLGFARGHPPYY